MAENMDNNESTQWEQETESDKEIISFVVEHTDRWRDYRDQNFLDSWEEYERIFRGEWEAGDKTRESERSRIISPATQQAIETRHAEIMEAIFGDGEYFDIEDDAADDQPMDVAQLKIQLQEDLEKQMENFDGTLKELYTLIKINYEFRTIKSKKTIHSSPL
jgi:hypothetical protein